MKNFTGKISFFLIVLLIFTFPLFSDQQVQNTIEKSKVNEAVNYISSLFTLPECKFRDVRISPETKDERGAIVPVEIGFICTEKDVVSFLKGILGFSGNDIYLAHRVMGIEVSSFEKVFPSGKALLNVNYHFVVAGKPEKLLNLDDMPHIKVLCNILKCLSFEPQVKEDQILNKTPWVYSFRIDSDQKFQLIGYAFSTEMVTLLVNDLKKVGIAEVSVAEMNEIVFEKVPVWRFGITGAAE
ncbi:MAG: hypothetical protein HQM08_19465 [Candidatus Riflebacteria bacterium]|nr:hypothetical protein [Candidatus Riflebacteria bacterium]